MRPFVFCVTAVLVHGLCAAMPPGVGGERLRFDGVYRSTPSSPANEDPSCGYLRFYPNRTVIEVASECTGDTPRALKKWFVKEKAGRNVSGVSKGNYRLHHRGIAFHATSMEGVVTYKGTLHANTLKLHSHSQINGYAENETYVFVPW